MAGLKDIDDLIDCMDDFKKYVDVRMSDMRFDTGRKIKEEADKATIRFSGVNQAICELHKGVEEAISFVKQSLNDEIKSQAKIVLDKMLPKLIEKHMSDFCAMLGKEVDKITNAYIETKKNHNLIMQTMQSNQVGLQNVYTKFEELESKLEGRKVRAPKIEIEAVGLFDVPPSKHRLD